MFAPKKVKDHSITTDASRIQIAYFLLIASSLLRNHNENFLLDSDPAIFAMILMEVGLLSDLVGITESESLESSKVTRNQCFDALLNFMGVDQGARRPGREKSVFLNAHWLRVYADRIALPKASYLSRCFK